MLHSGKTVDKAIASKVNAEKNHDKRKYDPITLSMHLVRIIVLF
jgi:hypothetical protein